LPDFLIANPGLNSGLMVAQYTAAALVNHNKVLATPASVDTIPTCQLQEDHVSMGGTSGVKLLQIIDHASTVLAIELLAAAQATELVPELVPSERTRSIVQAFRQDVPALTEDRVLAGDIVTARSFIERQLPRFLEGLS
jgi:histidine ammonia-lyase